MKTATMMAPKGAAPNLRHNRFEWWRTKIREGVVAGTLGGAVVALWYLVCDSIAGRPFHTPALLGAIFFKGLHGHDMGAATLAPVVELHSTSFCRIHRFRPRLRVHNRRGRARTTFGTGGADGLRMLRDLLPRFRHVPRRVGSGSAGIGGKSPRRTRSLS